jgi:hypothetical protein
MEAGGFFAVREVAGRQFFQPAGSRRELALVNCALQCVHAYMGQQRYFSLRATYFTGATAPTSVAVIAFRSNLFFHCDFKHASVALAPPPPPYQRKLQISRLASEGIKSQKSRREYIQQFCRSSVLIFHSLLFSPSVC